MPKLYLLRHTEASSSLETSDAERTLTTHGIDQAKKVGDFLKEINAEIDLAICSGSKRTLMTLAAVEETFPNIKKSEINDKLYNAPAGEILNTIQRAPNDNILIVAHNPGIHDVVRTLVGEGDKEKIDIVNMFYSPGTLSVLECKIKNWNEIQPRQNILEDLFIPD